MPQSLSNGTNEIQAIYLPTLGSERLPAVPRQLHFPSLSQSSSPTCGSDVETGQSLALENENTIKDDNEWTIQIKNQCKDCIVAAFNHAKSILVFLWMHCSFEWTGFFMAYVSLVLAVLSMSDIVGRMAHGKRVLPTWNILVDVYFAIAAIVFWCKEEHKTWWKRVVLLASFMPLSSIFVYLSGEVSARVAAFLCSLYLLLLLYILTLSFSIYTLSQCHGWCTVFRAVGKCSRLLRFGHSFFGTHSFRNPLIGNGECSKREAFWKSVLLLALVIPVAFADTVAHQLAAAMHNCAWVVRGQLEDASFPTLIKWAIYDSLADFFGLEKPYP